MHVLLLSTPNSYHSSIATRSSRLTQRLLPPPMRAGGAAQQKPAAEAEGGAAADAAAAAATIKVKVRNGVVMGEGQGIISSGKKITVIGEIDGVDVYGYV